MAYCQRGRYLAQGLCRKIKSKTLPLINTDDTDPEKPNTFATRRNRGAEEERLTEGSSISAIFGNHGNSGNLFRSVLSVFISGKVFMPVGVEYSREPNHECHHSRAGAS